MRTISAVLLLFFCLSSLQATHNLGGLISYEHIQGREYQIKIVTYTDPGSAADRNELEIYWGDGSSKMLSRQSTELVSPGVQLNLYTGNHTYAADGTYVVWMEDPNRNAGVINIPQSVSVPFYLESEIVVSSGSGNSSANFFTAPIFYANINESFSHLLSAYDSEGDIVSYELIAPQGANGSVGSIPTAATINQKSGELNWTPGQAGLFNFTVKVKECRNGVNLGYSIIDFQVAVSNSSSSAQFSSGSGFYYDQSYKVVSAQPGQSIQVSLQYDNTAADSTKLSVYSEAEALGLNVNSSSIQLSNTQSQGSFSWMPGSTDVRCAPYKLIFRGHSYNSGPLSEKDFPILIFVRDNSITCNSSCQGQITVSKEEFDYNPVIKVSPNPFSESITFDLSEQAVSFPIQISLYNLKGQKLKESKDMYQSIFSLKRGKLAAGAYLYQISDKRGARFSGKILITD